jgi:lysophospholipid acyltransferase (LPLAT)-like uncharacterized protein
LTEPKKKKKKTLKKRILGWLMMNIVPTLGYYYIQLVGRTSKWVIIDAEKNFAVFHGGKPYIASFWHNRLLLMAFIFKIEGGKNVFVMISRSDDGLFISKTVRKFGINCSYGSSTRGGKEALEEMIRMHQDEGVAMAITPDGPLGPKEEVKMGVIIMSKETGIPIYTLAYHAKRVWRPNSWDRFVVVLPFNEIYCFTTDPVIVAKDATDAQMEASRKELEDKMRMTTRFVEDYAAGRETLEGRSFFYSRVSLWTGKPVWTRANGEIFTPQDLVREQSNKGAEKKGE